MNPNGHAHSNQVVQRALQQAQAEQQAQAQLLAVLQHTINSPHTIKRAQLNLTGVVMEGHQAVLLVALPSGERWDIPVDPQAARQLGRMLLGIEDPAQDSAA